MPSKLQIYSQMARDAAGTVNASVGQWTGFLTTAARLYKYPYEDQLMIFTQRPDATDCMQKRNRYMVDHADYILAVWNGRPSGTGKTVAYARSTGKRVILINPKANNVFGEEWCTGKPL